MRKVEGGYKLYFTKGEEKNYFGIVKSDKFTNAKFGPEYTNVFTWDETLKTFVTDIEGKKAYFGTSAEKTFTTIGASTNQTAGAQFVVTLTEVK